MGKLNLITVLDSRSPVSEAYRTLRTNIQFSSIDKKVQVMVVTSSVPGEGKSTIAANLAVVLAESGNRTILIDCDQRKSRQHKIFQVSNSKGLSDILAEQCSYEDILNETDIKDLYIITTGTHPPNPSELLASEKMHSFIEKLREDFSYIILDTPPVLMVTDAQLLSGYSDGVILVASSSEVDRDAAVKAKELLEKVNSRILGVILNKVKLSEKGYFDRYSNYYYDSDSKHDRRKRRKLR